MAKSAYPSCHCIDCCGTCFNIVLPPCCERLARAELDNAPRRAFTQQWRVDLRLIASDPQHTNTTTRELITPAGNVALARRARADAQ